MIVIPKAILFDMDDTLISLNGVTQKALELACLSFFEKYSVPFDYRTLTDAVVEVKNQYWSDPENHRAGRLDLDNTRRKLFLKAFSLLQHNVEKEAYHLADSYGKHMESLVHVLPHTISTLEALVEANIKMGLITNGSSIKQRAKIQRFALEQYFEFCLIEEEAGYGKPDIRIYEDALSLLNMDASDVWMVGDNLTWDIEAPQKLGIYSIWVDNPIKLLAETTGVTPDKTISDISELLLLI